MTPTKTMNTDNIESAIKEIGEVLKEPMPWKDCICQQVSGDNPYCVIHST